jgi:predicted ribosome-associated RNA-binding protein Tma20
MLIMTPGITSHEQWCASGDDVVIAIEASARSLCAHIADALGGGEKRGEGRGKKKKKKKKGRWYRPKREKPAMQ